jgi:Family of unknown function (DUF6481)
VKKKRDTDLVDRLTLAANAKKALLENYKAVKQDPQLANKLAERKAVADAREMRHAERARLAAEEKQRQIEAEQAALAEKAAMEQAEAIAREEADRRRIAQVIEDEAARKAERDRRYANRKARQG